MQGAGAVNPGLPSALAFGRLHRGAFGRPGCRARFRRPARTRPSATTLRTGDPGDGFSGLAGRRTCGPPPGWREQGRLSLVTAPRGPVPRPRLRNPTRRWVDPRLELTTFVPKPTRSGGSL